MNWLFEKLLGKKEHRVPSEAKVLTREVGLDDAEKFIEGEMNLEFAGLYAESKNEMAEIEKDFRRLDERVKELLEKPAAAEREQHKRIAAQMKENYLKRIPRVLKAIRVPAEIRYGSIAGFHVQVLAALKEFDKVTSDNRYLLFFYKDSFKELGKEMKLLVEKVEALGKMLKENEKKAEGFEDAGRNAQKLLQARNRTAELAEQAKALKAKALEAKKNIDSAKKERIGKEIMGIEEKLAELKAAELSAKTRISAALSPLQRLFRKYEKRCLDKGQSRTLKAYLENAQQALFSEAEGLPLLKAVCLEAGKLLGQGKLEKDEKAKAKYLALIESIKAGSLEEPRKEIERLGSEMKEIEGGLRTLKGEKLLLEEAEAEAAKAGREATETEREAERERMLLESKAKELEEKTGKLTGKTVVLRVKG